MFNNFGGRFAYQFQGGEQTGWTPPWLREDEPQHHHGHHGHHHGPQGWGPRFFMRRGRGPFGPGPFGPGPFGPGPFGPGAFGPQGGPRGEGRRFFGRGDVKFALLELLRERPMHGYEMMKALEEKSGGFYTPSAGTIYPTLQMLEDRNLVTAQETDGKKVYSITDAGSAFLEEQLKANKSEEFDGPPWARGRGFGPRGPKGFRNAPEMQALGTEAREVARLFAIAARSSFSNPEQVNRLRTIIEGTRKDLSDLIYGSNPGTTPGTETPAASSETPNVEQA